MNADDLQQTINHLGRHWGDKPCPSCAETDQWAIDEDLCVLLRVRGEQNEVQANDGYLVSIVRCDNCGYSMMFSAKTMGVR